MSNISAMPAPPTTDKRWKLVDAAIKRHGRAGHSLIECLHTMQECFGYLDEQGLKYVAAALNLPLSKVYGVATFYHIFTLKPQGVHSCVVCLGTACYVKGANHILAAVEEHTRIKAGGTTEDSQFSLLTARCIGACGIAPAVVYDGTVTPRQTAESTLEHVRKWVAS